APGSGPSRADPSQARDAPPGSVAQVAPGALPWCPATGTPGSRGAILRPSARETPMSDQSVSDPQILHPADIEPFDRGTGVKTLPLVGKWNTQGNKVTTGITIFGPGTQIPLHTHNVEETVMGLEGEATAGVAY